MDDMDEMDSMDGMAKRIVWADVHIVHPVHWTKAHHRRTSEWRTESWAM